MYQQGIKPMVNFNFSGQCAILALAVIAIGCNPVAETSMADKNSELIEAVDVSNEMIVEVSCGQCQFGLPGDGCDLAVRIDGKAYYVDGISIDELGDAHAADGLCNAVRSAKVVGKIEDGRFVASSCKLLPADKQQHKKPVVGVALAMDGDNMIIAKVFPDSPAEMAGLQKDDILVSLNETPVAGLEKDALLSILTDNSTLRFSIQRDGQPKEITVNSKAE